jgi:hypothetical protein
MSAVGLGYDFDPYVAEAFADIGYPVPTRSGAAYRLSRHIAQGILEGGIGEYEGASLIVALSHDVDEELYWPTFGTFSGLASELYDHPELLSHYAPQIRDAAAQLLGETRAH